MPFCPTLPGGDRADCSTISRFADSLDAAGEFDRESLILASRSSIVGDAAFGGDRVLVDDDTLGSPAPPDADPCAWLTSVACPMGLGCGGSMVGSAGLGEFAFEPSTTPCLISGECNVACWRNGTGGVRAPLVVLGAVGEDTRRLMLPTRDRFGSDCMSSGPGLSGRFASGGEGLPATIAGCLLIECGEDWEEMRPDVGGERIATFAGGGGGGPKLRGSDGPERYDGVLEMVSSKSATPPSS